MVASIARVLVADDEKKIAHIQLTFSAADLFTWLWISIWMLVRINFCNRLCYVVDGDRYET